MAIDPPRSTGRSAPSGVWTGGPTVDEEFAPPAAVAPLKPGAVRRARFLAQVVSLVCDFGAATAIAYTLVLLEGGAVTRYAGVPVHILAAGLFVAVAWVGGAYVPKLIASGHGVLRGVFVAAIAGLGLCGWLTGANLGPTLGTILFLSLAALLVREGCARLFGTHALAERVIILGVEELSAAMARSLPGVVGPTHHVLGFVDDRTDPRRYPRGTGAVLGRIADASQIARQYQADVVVVGIAGALRPAITEALSQCIEEGMDIVRVADFYTGCFQKVPVEHISDASTLYGLQPERSAAFELAKRAIDVVCGLAGVLSAVLMAPAVLIVNRLWSPGPLFYRQMRVGQHGHCFRLVKFRTMVLNAEEAGVRWSSQNDERVTAVGRFLRKTHLDELPQCWNVLRGDMSMVGPRPERPEFCSRLEKEIPHFPLRHLVKPGITGLATVRNGYANTLRESLWKTEYDLYYVKHRSIWLDLWLMLETLLVCFVGRRPQRVE